MRLINAEDIIYSWTVTPDGKEHDGVTLQSIIKSMPTIETEIIYCRDCKHLQQWRSEESAKKFGQIYKCARNVLDYPKPEEFCSRAERRTNE